FPTALQQKQSRYAWSAAPEEALFVLGRPYNKKGLRNSDSPLSKSGPRSGRLTSHSHLDQ
ncbi:hypothetical protein, partial [Diaphorobacter ruginosibacter]|uniref:hypothetical protein n=1 Tax=Diaphorobacter ruginosibacter TaxID=1715720 RepID=UPI00333F6EFA